MPHSRRLDTGPGRIVYHQYSHCMFYAHRLSIRPVQTVGRARQASPGSWTGGRRAAARTRDSAPMGYRVTTQREVSVPGGYGPASGAARLGVVTAAALITFLQQGLLLYLLPLYFPAKSLPSSSWETWGLYQVSAWVFAPLLSWLLARRMALRLVWASGLAVSALVFAALIVLPNSVLAAAPGIGAAGLLYGAAGAVVWTSGITLAQRVPHGRVGRANALMMVSLGLGSIAGPGLGGVAPSVARPVEGAPLTAYLALLGLGASLAIAGALLVAAWGQHAAAELVGSAAVSVGVRRRAPHRSGAGGCPSTQSVSQPPPKGQRQ